MDAVIKWQNEHPEEVKKHKRDYYYRKQEEMKQKRRNYYKKEKAFREQVKILCAINL